MKKKTAIYAGIIVLSLVLCACKGQEKAAEEPSSEVLLGGWEMTEHEAQELPEDAQKVFDTAKEKLTDGEYTPVSLLATQLVAGTNYCILCQVDPKDATGQKWTLVYIYADLQGNAEIMNTYDLYIAQHSMPKEWDDMNLEPEKLNISPMPKTWILDLDGTLLVHDGLVTAYAVNTVRDRFCKTEFITDSNMGTRFD